MDKEQLEREQWKEEKRKKKARFTACALNSLS